MKNDKEMIRIIRDFISAIGIGVQESDLPDTTFLPGIFIDQGTLLIDTDKLAYPGDLLHEAGHIAVTLPDERPFLTGNIIENRPDKSGDEMAVLLWTYAACLHIDIGPEIVFHPAGYRGEHEWLIEQFSTGSYVGLPLLVWMGLTDPVHSASGQHFPAMKSWLRTNPVPQ